MLVGSGLGVVKLISRDVTIVVWHQSWLDADKKQLCSIELKVVPLVAQLLGLL